MTAPGPRIDDDGTLDVWLDDFIAQALRPQRARLATALSQVTRADEALCTEVVREGHADPLRAVNIRAYALCGRTFAGHTSPAEAWEAAAPDGWVGDPSRAFVPDEGGAPGLCPSSLRSVVWLASDPVGMRTAESLVAEYLARMAPRTHSGPVSYSGEASAPRVVWRACDVRACHAGWLVHDLAAVIEADSIVEHLGFASAPSEVARDRGARAALRVQRAMTARCGPAAQSVAELVRFAVWYVGQGEKNPYAPLADLWKMGYALLETTPVPVLAAPYETGYAP